jgi:ADP-ribosylglycohydrolase
MSGEVSRTYRQRALGAVIGSAIGDALGAPFEFGPAGAYRVRFPERIVGGIGEMVRGGSFGSAPSEFTDDTQMAIVQAESLLAGGGAPRQSVGRGDAARRAHAVRRHPSRSGRRLRRRCSTG